MTAAATRRPPDSRKDEGFGDRHPTAHVAEIKFGTIRAKAWVLKDRSRRAMRLDRAPPIV